MLAVPERRVTGMAHTSAVLLSPLPQPGFELTKLKFRLGTMLSFRVWNKDFVFLIWKLNIAKIMTFVL